MKTKDEWITHITTNVFMEGVSGCWIWKKAIRKDGYGITWYNGNTDYIHRVSYRIFNGDFDPAFIIRHTCDNPSCCNPAHLVIGSDQDNSNDMVNRGRSLKGSKQPLSKLVEDNIQPIRDSILSSRVLGNLLGVSKSVILDIKNNKTWKHV